MLLLLIPADAGEVMRWYCFSLLVAYRNVSMVKVLGLILQ